MINANYVILDLDGTIIDSFDSVCQSLSLTLDVLSLPIPSEGFYELFRNEELSSLFKAAYDGFGKCLSWKSFKSAFDEVYSHHCTEDVRVTSTGNAIVECCKRMNVRMVVLTNKRQLAADIVCTSLFPVRTFADIIGRDGVRPIKPYKYAVNKLVHSGFPTEMCKACFGDSSTDEKMAMKMGVDYYDIRTMDESQIQTIVQTCVL